jgi:hypothetical protein
MRVVVGAGLSSPFNIDYNCVQDCENPPPNLVFSPVFDLLVDQHSPDRWQVPWNYDTVDEDRLDPIQIITNP